MSTTMYKYLMKCNTASHIVTNQLQEEFAMSARMPWISLIVTFLTMLYIGFATAYWPPADDADYWDCDDDCQQDAYLDKMVEEHEQQLRQEAEENNGFMQDSAGELMIAIPSASSSLNCFGPSDKHMFNKGSDAWEALNSGKNIEISGTFIRMIWDSNEWLYTLLGFRKPGDNLSDHDHIPSWKGSYGPSFTCP